MLGVLAAICCLNSARCAARMRPISLIAVPCSPGTVSIFKVTAIWQPQSVCRLKLFEQIAVAGKSVAVFWEIAKFSARSP
jgi:hypothetical protein